MLSNDGIKVLASRIVMFSDETEKSHESLGLRRMHSHKKTVFEEDGMGGEHAIA